MMNMSQFAGGMIAGKVSIGYIYLILVGLSLLMALFILFIFDEPKKLKYLSNPKLILKQIWTLLKVMVTPFILLPLIYASLQSTVPKLTELGSYILLGAAGWTFTSLSMLTLLMAVLTTIAFNQIANNLKKSVSFSEILTISCFGLGVAMVLNLSFLKVREYPFWLMFLIQTV